MLIEHTCDVSTQSVKEGLIKKIALSAAAKEGCTKHIVEAVVDKVFLIQINPKYAWQVKLMPCKSKCMLGKLSNAGQVKKTPKQMLGIISLLSQPYNFPSLYILYRST